mmetsp:Transcript_45465/g.83195  ORF Transcript_45465/g.83195 Transcript_45465/m.83195 type:complete len:319 (-) Transcript_45465:146-1102(-)
MELMWGGPVHHSAMEAEDLAADEDSASEPEGLDEVNQEAAAKAAPNLRDRFIRPRMLKWLLMQSHHKARRDLLDEMFGRLEVLGHAVQVNSSERTLKLDFKLMSMSGHYCQVSQADPQSPVWEMSEGDFKLIPNVEVELFLDNEPLLRCSHHAARPSAPAGKLAGKTSSSTWVDEEGLQARFGAETVSKLGGLQVLLQFFGAICVDAGASGYAEALPFGLSSTIVNITEENEAETSALYLPPPRPPIAKASGAAEAKRPQMTVTTTSIEPKGGSRMHEAPPGVPIMPQQPTSARPNVTRPRGSSQGRRITADEGATRS